MIQITTVFVLLAMAVVMVENASKKNELVCPMCSNSGIFTTTGRCAMCYWYEEDRKDSKSLMTQCGCLTHGHKEANSIDRCTKFIASTKEVAKSGSYGCCNKDICSYPKKDTGFFTFFPNLKKGNILCAQCRYGGIWIVAKDCKWCYWYADNSFLRGNHLECGCLKEGDPNAANHAACDSWASSQHNGEVFRGCCNDKDICNHPKNFDFDIDALYRIEDRA